MATEIQNNQLGAHPRMLYILYPRAHHTTKEDGSETSMNNFGDSSLSKSDWLARGHISFFFKGPKFC